jgi:hypothetical protein
MDFRALATSDKELVGTSASFLLFFMDLAGKVVDGGLEDGVTSSASWGVSSMHEDSEVTSSWSLFFLDRLESSAPLLLLMCSLRNPKAEIIQFSLGVFSFLAPDPEGPGLVSLEYLVLMEVFQLVMVCTVNFSSLALSSSRWSFFSEFL